MENQELVKIESSPMGLMEIALQKGADINTLERLMDLQQKWEAKESRKMFFDALSRFQASCPDIEKKQKVNYPLKEGGVINYKFAPLGDIVSQIRNLLLDTGLSYRWEIDNKENGITVTCIISHLAGHSEKTEMTAQKDSSGKKNDIQQHASTVTYLKRYTLTCALGIATADEDIDGRLNGNVDVNTDNFYKDTEKALEAFTTDEQVVVFWNKLKPDQKEVVRKLVAAKRRQLIADAEKQSKQHNQTPEIERIVENIIVCGSLVELDQVWNNLSDDMRKVPEVAAAWQQVMNTVTKTAKKGGK